MDARITLSFNEAVIIRAKKYADNNNISLSRLVEFLLQKVTSGHHQTLEDFPVAEWVSLVAEGDAVYQTSKKRTRKASKSDYFSSKK